MELHERDLQIEAAAHKAPPTMPYRSFKLSYAQLRIGRPYRSNDPAALLQELLPQECRMAGKTYTAPLLAVM